MLKHMRHENVSAFDGLHLFQCPYQKYIVIKSSNPNPNNTRP